MPNIAYFTTDFAAQYATPTYIVNTDGGDVNGTLPAPVDTGTPIAVLNIGSNNAILTSRGTSAEINGGSSFTVPSMAATTFLPDGDNNTWRAVSNFNPDLSGGLVIQAGQSLTYSDTPYDGDGSFQPIGPDLNLDADAGTSEAGDSAYLAPIMGNVIGDALTKTKNLIAGLIGKLSVTGNRASTYPVAGVIGEVGDGVSEADGAFVAVLGGDSEQTNARAAYTVDNQNSTPNSAFEYGADLQGVDHDSYGLVDYSKAPVRLNNDVVFMTGSGAPVDGTTGDNFAGKGSLYFDYTNGTLYQNTGTISDPVWVLKVSTVLSVNAQTDTTYTLQASDNGKVVTLSNGSAITVTVPAGLGAGFNCVCVQLGAGQVSFTASGTTVNNRQSHTKIAGQYGEVSLVAYAADTFVLAGDTAA